MKAYVRFSFRHKAILVLVLLMNVPFLVTGYMANNVTRSVLLREKADKLEAFARILDSRLSPGGFAAILREQGAEHASREEKMAVLNAALASITDAVGMAAPGLGVGYYSRELDAIITYGPSSSFAQNVGRSVPADHPGRVVMSDNKTLVQSGGMVRGDILNAMIPIERGGEVIGYIWANELATDVSTQLNDLTRTILFVVVFCFALTMATLLLLSRRTLHDVDRIIKGVRAMRGDLSQRIEGSGGELGEVVDSINAMAADIETANEETNRAIAVLQSVMSNVEAAVYVCDPETKELVYTNDYLRTLLGGEDMQGQACHQVLHGNAEPCSFCPQQHLFDANGKPVHAPVCWEGHYKRINRDFLIVDRLVTWHDGRLLHMQVGTDITERKALALAEAANLAQREFLARMSHEIRTPMNGVLGMTRLAMKADPPAAQLEYLRKIQSSASLLLGIINDILDFSRIEAGKLSIEKRVFNVREMVENIRELVAPRAQENKLDLVIAVEDSVPEYALGDALRLSQVLLNLLGNASKFTLSGSVSLHMRAEYASPDALHVFCDVSDTGIGMSEEQQQALFKPFSQADSSTSRRFGGTGLGLSISRALVELMGGRISARSTPDEGSVFSFYVVLSAADGLPEETDEAENAYEAARYNGYKFLLVEDNAINQEIGLAILTEIGADVDVANNGEEGLKAFMLHDYAAILMDVRMPVMDGLEATRRIRASVKHDARTVPVIAMTANAMREDREASEEAGMNGHIAKPIDVLELKRALFRCLKEGGGAKKAQL